MLPEYLSVVYEHELKKKASRDMVESLKRLPNEELHKLASGNASAAMKVAFSDGEDWLGKYKGSPLFEQAIGLEKELLQIEMKEQQQNEARRAMRDQMGDCDDFWRLKDAVRLKKRMLDLDLAMAQEGGAPAGHDELEAAEGMGLEMASEAHEQEMAQQGKPPIPVGGGAPPPPVMEEEVEASPPPPPGPPAGGPPSPPKPKAEEKKPEEKKPEPEKKEEPKEASVDVAFLRKVATEKTALIDSAIAGFVGAGKARNAGYDEPGQAFLRGGGGWMGGAALGGGLGQALAQGRPSLLPLAGALGGGYAGYKALTSKYNQPAPAPEEKAASVKTAFIDTALAGLMAQSKARHAGYKDEGAQSFARGAGGWMGGGMLGSMAGAGIGGALGRGNPAALVPAIMAGSLGGGMLGYKALTNKYNTPAEEKVPPEQKTPVETKEANVGALMGGLKGMATKAMPGVGGALTKAAPNLGPAAGVVNRVGTAVTHGGALGGAKAMGRMGANFARQNPLAAAGLAGGAGLVAGKMMD